MSLSQSSQEPWSSGFIMSDAQSSSKGVLLENLTWIEAERALTPDTVIVIPLGAAAKEHGPHLPLKNDLVLAEYLKQRVLEVAAVVVAPTISYSFYPAFLEYAGSISLRLETARDTLIDICRSLSRYGPRRFYVLNTGISTIQALQLAAEALATECILLHYTDFRIVLGPIESRIAQQEGGTHADEIETSIMLAIAPSVVDMSKAVKDYHSGRGGLTRSAQGKGVYSPSGVYGDPTLATREKGDHLVETLIVGILQDIEALRRSKLPQRL